MQAKFPYSMNFGITAPMFEAIQELSSPSSPFTQSDVGRHSVHSYLLTHSERYRRAMKANPMTTGNGNG